MKKLFKALAGMLFLATIWNIQVLSQSASSPANQAKAQATDKSEHPTDPKDLTVYITRTGTKYHSAGCRYLAKSSKMVSLKEALDKGLTQCSVCKPPKADSEEKSSGAALSSVSQAPKNSPPKGNKEHME